jgi:hypothetical protein
MNAAVQTTCPRCLLALRVPAARAHLPAKCPGCAAIMRLRATARQEKRADEDVYSTGRAAWLPAIVVGLVSMFLAGGATAAGWSMLRPSRPAAVSEETPAVPIAAAPGRKAPAAPPKDKAGEALVYERDIQPLVKQYCLRCHSSDKAKGGVKLDRDKDEAAVLKNLGLWEKVGDNLRSGEMPPAGSKKPGAAEMDRLNRWLDDVVFKTDCTKAKDPGRVTIRRLNRTEYPGKPGDAKSWV